MKPFILIKQKKYLFLPTLFLTAILVWTVSAHASDLSIPEVYGVAINGYDPVAYFTKGKAMNGTLDYTHNWNEATWYFISQNHRDMFAASPEKYAPNHGGF